MNTTTILKLINIKYSQYNSERCHKIQISLYSILAPRNIRCGILAVCINSEREGVMIHTSNDHLYQIVHLLQRH